jgi:hypothetical protein
MNPNFEEPRLIKAAGPVNRRTAMREQRKREEQQAASHPLLRQRLQRVRMRSIMGAPLAEQLTVHRSQPQHAPRSILIACGMVIASGAVLTLLGVIQSSTMTLSIGITLGTTGLLGMIWLKRQNKKTADFVVPAQPLFDLATIHAFDRVIEEAAPELGDAAVGHLTAIKTAIVRMAQHGQRVDEHFTTEDRLYLRECLRRYIPDTLEAFLRVPAGQRSHLLLEGEASAESNMLNQLVTLHDEITQREKKIGRSAAEDLMKQDRFLASKKSR